MKRTHFVASALVLAMACAPALASQDEQHAAHHPDAPAPAAKASPDSDPAPAATHAPSAESPDLAAMDAHVKAMHEMHEKMMAAKSPAERKALMAEQEALMRKGMSMMRNPPASSAGDMGCDMGEHHQHMAKHMEMMEAMMQMMLDRHPEPSEH